MSSLPPIPDPSYTPLQYATSLGPPPRPGMMTAVGIMSIIVGSLSTLGSIYTVLSALMFMFMSQMSFPMPVPTTMPAGPNGVVATTWPTTAPAGQVNVTMKPFSFKVDHGASELMIAEGVLSLGVAILLIFAGAMQMRNSPKSFRMHRLYVILKLPLIVVAAFATWWTASGMMNNMMNNMNNLGGGAVGVNMPGFGNLMGVVQAIFSAGISLAYPVTLIIILSTKTSKEYFKRISTGSVG